MGALSRPGHFEVPDAHAAFAFKLVVGPNGIVKSATLTESTLAAADVERCLEGVLVRARFPHTGDNADVIVSHPFVFKSE